jgi:hypothetical protein
MKWNRTSEPIVSVVRDKTRFHEQRPLNTALGHTRPWDIDAIGMLSRISLRSWIFIHLLHCSLSYRTWEHGLVISLLAVIHCRSERLTCVSPIFKSFYRMSWPNEVLLLLCILEIMASNPDLRLTILIEVISDFSQLLHPRTRIENSSPYRLLLDVFFALLTLKPWRWKQYGRQKRQ